MNTSSLAQMGPKLLRRGQRQWKQRKEQVLLVPMRHKRFSGEFFGSQVLKYMMFLLFQDLSYQVWQSRLHNGARNIHTAEEIFSSRRKPRAGFFCP